MKMQRQFAVLTRVLAGAICAIPLSVFAFQPSSPVELVIHGGPGSGADLFARSIATISDKDKLQKAPFRVNPKTGGNGATAMSYMAEKAGAPHTLGIFTTVWIATPLTSPEAKVSLKELAPIAILVRDPSVVVVKANSPYGTMNDFINAARKSPGQLKQAGGSLSSVDNLARLLMQRATGANWTLISFAGGSERLTNLLGEHVQILFVQPQEISEHVRSGTLRVIASITEKRLHFFPNVPTLAEQGINMQIPHQVRGIVAPPGLPKDAGVYWDEFFSRLAENASWKKYVEDNQFEPGFMKGAELNSFLETNTNNVRALLKDAGAKVVR